MTESRCIECGMPCKAHEYHPYAACMMYRDTPDADAVRINLGYVLDHGRALERDRLASSATGAP